MSEREMQTETCSAEVDWLYPELLSTEGLIEILKQRYFVPSDLNTLERQKLLELYYRHAIPLPQRKYRPNRRGREMTRKQIIQAKKRRKLYPDEFEPPEKKSHLDDGPAARFMTSASLSSASEDRLKPPPSQINFERKTIKLGSGGKQTTSSDITLTANPDKTINSVAGGKLPTSSKFKRIMFSDSDGESVAQTGGNVQRAEENDSKSARKPISFPDSKVDSSKKIIRLNSSSSSSSDESISRPMSKTIKLIQKHLGLHESSPGAPDNIKSTCKTIAGSTRDEAVVKTKDMSHEDADTHESNETEIVPRKKVKIKRISFP